MRKEIYDRTNFRFWTEQITPELTEQAKQATAKRDEAFRAMRETKPIHPETGEVGKFSHFVGAHTRMMAVYKTDSGIEFTRPVSME